MPWKPLIGGISRLQPQVQPQAQDQILQQPVKPAAPRLKPPDDARALDDFAKARESIYDSILEGVAAAPPISLGGKTLRLTNLKWSDPPDSSPEAYRKALIEGKSLERRLTGVWQLLDADNKIIEQKRQVVLRAPVLTDRGVFVRNGTNWTIRNQQRLRSGAYVRRKNNGEIEAHINHLPGEGLTHRLHMNPRTGVFQIEVQQAKLPLYPLLQHLGADDKKLEQLWGKDILEANKAAGGKLDPYIQKFLKSNDRGPNELIRLKEVMTSMKLDPEVTKRTLGQAFDRTGSDFWALVAAKVLKVNKREAEVDDRDHYGFQKFMGPDDLFYESLKRDAGYVRQELLRRSLAQGLKSIPSSSLQPQIDDVLLRSGLGEPLTEINPLEVLDRAVSVTRMGTGGIPSVDSVPKDARNVQPTQYGFVDAVRTPENEKAGVDGFFAQRVYKGRDGKIYAPFKHIATGQEHWLTPSEAADAIVGFQGFEKWPHKKVPVHRDGKLDYVDRNKVEYVPVFDDTFSALSNLVMHKPSLKQHRLSMASRMLTQALPVRDGEAPLVQTVNQRGTPYVNILGKYAGAVVSDKDAIVVKVSPEKITVKQLDGELKTYDLANNLPFNRKTYLHQEPIVKPGDVLRAGQTIAKSNFTDKAGNVAVGLNARVAYLPYKGLSHEDAVVISEDFAKRLASQHAYHFDLEKDDKTLLGSKEFVSVLPGVYSKEIISRFDVNGLPKVGQELKKGDPIFLAAQQVEDTADKIYKRKQPAWKNASAVWDHEDVGVVIDSFMGKDGPVVVVKSESTMKVGDKLSGLHGDKGVISAIVSSHLMPKDSQGRPFEVLANPMGLQSRINPSQKIELMAGKLAAHLGQPQLIKDFEDEEDGVSGVELWLKRLEKHGLSPTERVELPHRGGKVLDDVPTGVRWFMKLHHTSESKAQARSGGSYGADDAPTKGGYSGAKRVALMDTNALLSHGAYSTLRDVINQRGRRREQMWLQFMQGHIPAPVGEHAGVTGFLDKIRAAGINPVKRGHRLQLMALNQDAVNRLAEGRFISKAHTVDFDEKLTPVTGGLFDPRLTGGHGGTQWAAIKLNEPMLNPAFEEPVRKVLGLTQQQLEMMISDHPQELLRKLREFNPTRELELTRNMWKMGNRTQREEAVRKMGYLKSMVETKQSPRDWILESVPVLPPKFRPVSQLQGKIPVVHDVNRLYQDLIDANENFEWAKKNLGDEGAKTHRKIVYNAFKAVVGLGDPVTFASRRRQAKGILHDIFGNNPKFSAVQRKLISTTVDNVGRAVIAPNPDQHIDDVGIPEEQAFDAFKFFIARRLRRQGLPLVRAMQEIKERSPIAKSALLKELEERPVLMNRAPVLHKYGHLAFRPYLVAGSVIRLHPAIYKGFNADNDGDTMNFYVPTLEEETKEAYEKLLPSKNLFSASDLKSPVHMPTREFQLGLYLLSSLKKNKKSGMKPTHYFKNYDDMWAAYRSGNLKADDEVVIAS